MLAGDDADMAEEPARERLFDVLMRRLEMLAPHKEAVRSLLRSARRNPCLAFALNAMAVHSQQWMLKAADIGASGPRGVLRAQGTALLFARVLAIWVDDDDPGHDRTMAALDRGLAAPSAGPASSTICALLALRCLAPSRAGDDAATTSAKSRRCGNKSVSRSPKVPAYAVTKYSNYTGTRTVARNPPSGLSPRLMSPPCERAMSRAIASPRPVPPSS